MSFSRGGKKSGRKKTAPGLEIGPDEVGAAWDSFCDSESMYVEKSCVLRVKLKLWAMQVVPYTKNSAKKPISSIT